MTSPPFRRGWGWKENWVSKCRWYRSHAWRFSWSSTYSEKSRGLKKEPRGTQTWGENGRAMCREGLRPTSSEVSGRIGEGSVIEAVTGSLLRIIFRIMSITISAWRNMPFMIWHPLFVLTFWLFPPLHSKFHACKLFVPSRTLLCLQHLSVLPVLPRMTNSPWLINTTRFGKMLSSLQSPFSVPSKTRVFP